jgi:hypothetical protein
MTAPDLTNWLAPLAALFMPPAAEWRMPDFLVQEAQPQEPAAAAPRPRAQRPRANTRPATPARRNRWSDVAPFTPASYTPAH